MKDRIRAIMEDKKMTQQSFANFIELSTASLSSIFNGRTNPTLKMVEAIKNKVPNININWLLFGEGEMYVEEKNDEVSSLSKDETKDEGLLNFDPTPNQSLGKIINPSSNFGASTLGGSFQEKPQRQVTEIRVFFDDLTYETFIPKK